MSNTSRTVEHDSRLTEMNNLLSHGEPTPGALKRMKELYHAISAKHLSPPNVEKFIEVADYLKRRESGMNHAQAYQTSLLYKKEREMMKHNGTKGANRSVRTRLYDKTVAPKLEAMFKEQLEKAEAKGIPKELMQTIMTNTIQSMGFRPEFNKSLLKAGVITELPKPKGGGAGSEQEIDEIVAKSVMKSLNL